MRYLAITPFEQAIEIPDFEHLIRTRLSQAIVIWPEQALSLIGYMGWPNDPQARAEAIAIVRGRPMGSKCMPRRLRQIEFDWTRIADIFSLHYDLEVGDHQRRRGGPSIGKAIELFAAQARSRGTGKANVWKAWAEYKDVAHLVTAATIICCEAHESAKVKPFGEFGLPRSQLRPFNIAMLLPDFVLSLALFWRNYGLEHYSQARDEPMLDPETLWRIPPDMNVSPIKPPVRKIDQRAIAILNARRAGNRGKGKHRETTPISS
jgi:hypothetical protein